MEWKRAGVFAAIALLAGPEPVAGQACFRAHQAPRCQSFWITELGIGARLAGAGGPSFTMEVGHMVNVGPRSALGATIFVQSVDEAVIGIRPRYRRWLDPEVSIDLALGLATSGASVQPSGQVALNFGSALALTTDVHLRNYYGPGTELAWYGGARFGAAPGLVGIVATFALGILIVASGGLGQFCC